MRYKKKGVAMLRAALPRRGPFQVVKLRVPLVFVSWSKGDWRLCEGVKRRNAMLLAYVQLVAPENAFSSGQRVLL